MKPSRNTKNQSGKSAVAQAIEAMLDRAASLVDALSARPQPAFVPVRANGRRRLR